MKEFIKENKDTILIILVSIITFLIGCFSIGPLISIAIIGILDAIVFITPIVINKNKKRHKIKKVKNSEKKNTKNIKSSKQKKKGKIKKVLKILVIICLVLFIIGIISGCLFWNYIVSNSPKFDPNELYQQESTIIYDKNGNIIRKLGIERRENITYDELPEVLINAIIATEDSRFFQHNGFDFPRFLKASIQAALGQDGGGASTLTMQLSKNAYTSKEVSIVRKFTDIYMAIFQIEKNYTKEEILEFYINYPYLGGGAYGVEQACQNYFGKSAKDINLAEAALIAGLFQSPGGYDPTMYPEKAEKRRQTVLYLMEKHGYITSEQRKAASKITVEKLLKQKNDTETNNVNQYDAFVDTVVREIRKKTGDDPYTVPMEIYTTMDPEKQTHVDKVMSGELFTWENDVVDGGIAVVDVKTGAIVAVGAIRPEHRTGEGSYNFAVQASKQIGSTSKPIYDYAVGIEYENWSTGKTFVDEPYAYSNGTIINNWDGKFNGVMTLREALAQSRNIPALKAFQQNKNANIKTLALNLGLHPEIDETSGLLHEAHAIGGYTGESPLNMAAAYAAFANEGIYTEPYSYTKIVYRNTGDTVETEIKKVKAMSTETAYMMTSLLQDSAKYGLGSQYHIGGAIYGAKTGTSNFDVATKAAHNLRGDAVNDLWVTGTSPDYAISVWYGYDTINSEYVNTVSNIQHRKLFQAVAKGIFINGSNFTKPNGVVEVEVEKGTDPLKLASDRTPQELRITELFKKGTEPTEVSTKYVTLDNVTNLNGSLKDKVVTLTWTGVSKQSEADASWGEIVYKIYEDNNLINTVSATMTTINITKGGIHKYIIKTSYQNYEGNMSSGAEVTVEMPEDAVFSLNNGNTITTDIGTTFTDPGYTVKVGDKDVTKSAKLVSKVITNAVTGNTVQEIDTDNVGTYTINYTIEYSGTTKILTRSVIVTAIPIDDEKATSNS